MEIITGYFNSSQQAVEAAEYLRQHGFKGEISIIGRHNEEAFRKAENARSNIDKITGMANYGVAGGLIGLSISLASFMLPGVGPLIAAGPIAGLIGGALGGELIAILTRWGVPEKEAEELTRVIESGNTVILIKNEENEEAFVRDTLQDKGAQNIHS
jgi:uncharacterized membrane protein